jgi:hypothetical protein
MSSETTKKQIERIDKRLDDADAQILAEYHNWLCQAKLALVRALEIQERMERDCTEDTSPHGGAMTFTIDSKKPR